MDSASVPTTTAPLLAVEPFEDAVLDFLDFDDVWEEEEAYAALMCCAYLSFLSSMSWQYLYQSDVQRIRAHESIIDSKFGGESAKQTLTATTNDEAKKEE
jgi:hypothetical protein